ncbi:MAG: oxidoreductase, partial [Lacunisphaera sp.]|nr:oxidoreductase [Lacunisphaera sp.]
MKQERVRIGVVGCGNRLRSVLRLLLSHGEGRFAVTAVYDPLPASCQALAQELGIRIAPATTAEAVCTSPDVDWVLIGSWNRFHAEQVIAAFNAGKDVFCEKPLAVSVEDCLRMQEAWRATKRTFFFGLVLRYAPIYQKIKELLDAGVVGQVVSLEFNETLSFNHGGYIQGNWRRDRANAGTHLLEKCCHDIDVVNWLTDSLPVRAASFGGRDFFIPENRAFATSLGTDKSGRAAYETWPDPERVDPFSAGSTVVDNQVAILEYAAGFRASFHTNCNAGIPERRVYILGTKGALRADVSTRRIEMQRIGFDTQREEFVVAGTPGDHLGGDEVMARHLSETMLTGVAPL